MALFNDLDTDVFLTILSFLNESSLTKLSFTNKHNFNFIHKNQDSKNLIWKNYCKELNCIFDPNIFNSNNGILTLNSSQCYWSNRFVYDLTTFDNFKISFDFFLVDNDSDLTIGFSALKPKDFYPPSTTSTITNQENQEENQENQENQKEENDCLLFRISGEADMTGTFVESKMMDEDDSLVYYVENTCIVKRKWYRATFILKKNSLNVLMNGKSVFLDKNYNSEDYYEDYYNEMEKDYNEMDKDDKDLNYNEDYNNFIKNYNNNEEKEEEEGAIEIEKFPKIGYFGFLRMPFRAQFKVLIKNINGDYKERELINV
ncbi:hypothetical protein ABK040_002699 [Willaertia magna]